MSKRIIKVNLITENFEMISLDSKFINSMNIENWSGKIEKYGDNLIEILKCKHFDINIHKKFNADKRCLTTFGKLDKERNQFNRLINTKDITSVEVVYEDGDNKEIYVDWKDNAKNEDINDYQVSYIDKNRNLVISIDKENEFKNNKSEKQILI